jgi:hypothetical protein
MFARVLTSGAIEVTDLDSCTAEVVWKEMTSAICIRAYDPDNPSSSDGGSSPSSIPDDEADALSEVRSIQKDEEEWQGDAVENDGNDEVEIEGEEAGGGANNDGDEEGGEFVEPMCGAMVLTNLST